MDLGLYMALQQLNFSNSALRNSIRVALDRDPVAISNYSQNFPNTPTLTGDIRQISTDLILREAGLSRKEPSLLIGGPPCTPFSKSGYWIKEKREGLDPDSDLLSQYARVLEESLPKAFVLENVQGLTYGVSDPHYLDFMWKVSKLGYKPSIRVLNAAEFGVPQLRKRLFIVGIRDGSSFEFPLPKYSGPTEHQTRFDHSKPPFITAGEVLKDLLPGKPESNEIVEGKYAILASKIPPGMNYLWHTERYGGDNVFKWRSRYWNFLLRLDPNRPSPTIQAQPGPWVGPFHWENVLNEAGEERARRLRIPEIKRLMTFPDTYRITGNRREQIRLLGNAVPPILVAAIFNLLIQHLNDDEREVRFATNNGEAHQLRILYSEGGVSLLREGEIDINNRVATRILENAYEKAIKKVYDVEWYNKTLVLWKMEGVTYPTFLGTALLARSVNAKIDPFSIKKRGPNSYSARTLAHEVLVPFASTKRFNLKAKGREPINNQPFFRYERVDSIDRTRNKPTVEFLKKLLSEISRFDESQSEQALTGFLRACIDETKEKMPELESGYFAQAVIIDKTKKFMQQNIEGGKTAQALVAALMDLVFEKVETKRVNDPSWVYPGDIQVFDRNTPILSIEVRAKYVSISDLIIFLNAVREKNIDKAVMVALANDSDSDISAELENVIPLGMTVSFVTDISELIKAIFSLSKKSAKELFFDFPNVAMNRLQKIEVREDTLIRWKEEFT